MYCSNIDPSIVALQHGVFARLGYTVEQQNATGHQHGEWLESVLRNLVQDDDEVLFVDIDAIPLTSSVVKRAFAAANSGRLFGLAQTANHLEDSSLIYAGPSFMSVKKATWLAAGQPSLRPDRQNDVAMQFTRCAIRASIEVELVYPTYVCHPCWRLADRGWFGHGTFYGDLELFHLFESRYAREHGLVGLFGQVAASVIRGETISLDHLAALPHIGQQSPWTSSK